ncbi:hypothetical protein Ancab_016781 [Ancistrocladus abbreviatus]
MNFTVAACRNRLSFLKNKYKKEKAKLEALGGGNSRSQREGEEEDGGNFRCNEDSESYRLLWDSIKRVGDIYEKIENAKRQHMMELEITRMEFQRDLEVQKKVMIERTRAEIAKIRQYEDDDSESSVIIFV